MLEEDDDDMEGYEPVPNAFDAFIEMSCTIKDAINDWKSFANKSAGSPTRPA